MKPQSFRKDRLAHGWTQAEAASKLGVSQPYYSQLESGFRSMPANLALTAVRKLRLSPIRLPLPGLNPCLSPLDPGALCGQLARLSYPGFAHVKKAATPMNPALVVAAALAHSDLDVRIVEAMPWVLAAFRDLDWGWLIAQCRLVNLQNRLGYLVTLALRLRRPEAEAQLADVLCQLEQSRLAIEGTLCRDSMGEAERNWARKHRTAEAAHWNLLTTLTAEQLTHAS